MSFVPRLEFEGYSKMVLLTPQTFGVFLEGYPYLTRNFRGWKFKINTIWGKLEVLEKSYIVPISTIVSSFL